MEKKKEMQYVKDALVSYSNSDMYPFHMPGHKRQKLDFPNPYSIDITEIDGFDNLHHAQGILKEAQERAAALYGSRRCYYLVNGSTCGLLAAICAAAKRGDRVLVARNSHKAVYHALALQGLSAEYLYPAITENDLQGGITPGQVEKALTVHSDVGAVIITSPTYEGILSDIAGIAEVCHTHGIPLIVDEAHGAHLGFGGGFPENAVRLGADAVIMSLHKTLPSFTQTALLHICSDRIATEQVERYLDIFETSSPSYVFMAGMDACIRLVTEQGRQFFEDYRKRLDTFYRETVDLKCLHVMRREDLSSGEAFDWDDSKLVIFAESGERLHQVLLHRYHLQMEMVSAHYVLGMTSIMDQKEGFDRLSAALHKIDAKWSDEAAGGQRLASEDKNTKETGFTTRIYCKNPCAMQIHQAMELPYQEVAFTEAEGKAAADYVFLYPPGIPLIVPGEIITQEFLENIRECQRRGLSVEGQPNLSAERIKIVYF